jgi:hypothetical protein
VSQRKIQQKAHQKPNTISSETFAFEQAEMTEFSDASDDIQEIPEMKEFFDNMEIEVCNQYVILSKYKTQSHMLNITLTKRPIQAVYKFGNLVQTQS